MALVLSFFAQDLSWALPEIKAPEQKAWAQKFLPKIPSSIATIEDAWKGGERTVLLIEDAHANTSAQLNLAKTLDLILKSRHPELSEGSFPIFVEGGFGDDSLSHLRLLASPEQRKRIARSYLQKGLLHGEEYLDIISKHNFKIIGAENKEQYLEALESYRTVATQREKFEVYLNRIDSCIRFLRSRLLNPSLDAFLSAQQSFQKNELSFIDYAQFLSQFPADNRYPNLLKLRRFKKTEQALEKRRVSARHQKAILDRQMRQASKFDYSSLMQELGALEKDVLLHLAQTPEEKMLVRSLQTQRYYRRLLNFQLTPEEHQSFQNEPMSARQLGGFLNLQLMHFKERYEDAVLVNEEFESLAARAQAFYEFTLKRDQTMAARVSSSSALVSALITGGYHSPNLKSLLKSKNISWIVLRPQVQHETNTKRYEQILLNQRIQNIPTANARPGTIRRAAIADTPIAAARLSQELALGARFVEKPRVYDVRNVNSEKLVAKLSRIFRKSGVSFSYSMRWVWIELLNNVRDHASGVRANLTMRQGIRKGQPGLEITLKDEGLGMDIRKALVSMGKTASGGLGFAASMQMLTTLFSGLVRVESRKKGVSFWNKDGLMKQRSVSSNLSKGVMIRAWLPSQTRGARLASNFDRNAIVAQVRAFTGTQDPLLEQCLHAGDYTYPRQAMLAAYRRLQMKAKYRWFFRFTKKGRKLRAIIKELKRPNSEMVQKIDSLLIELNRKTKELDERDSVDVANLKQEYIHFYRLVHTLEYCGLLLDSYAQITRGHTFSVKNSLRIFTELNIHNTDMTILDQIDGKTREIERVDVADIAKRTPWIKELLSAQPVDARAGARLAYKNENWVPVHWFPPLVEILIQLSGIHPSLPVLRKNAQGDSEIQWVEGPTFERWAYQSTLSDPDFVKQIVRWVIQIAEILCALHAIGIEHGDLTISNVIISESGDAVLIDFDDAVGSDLDMVRGLISTPLMARALRDERAIEIQRIMSKVTQMFGSEILELANRPVKDMKDFLTNLALYYETRWGNVREVFKLRGARLASAAVISRTDNKSTVVNFSLSDLSCNISVDWYSAKKIRIDRSASPKGFVWLRPAEDSLDHPVLELRSFSRNRVRIAYFENGKLRSHEIFQLNVTDGQSDYSLPPLDSHGPGRLFHDRLHGLAPSGLERARSIERLVKRNGRVNQDLSSRVSSPIIGFGGVDISVGRMFWKQQIPLRVRRDMKIGRFAVIEEELNPSNRLVLEMIKNGLVKIYSADGVGEIQKSEKPIRLSELPGGATFVRKMKIRPTHFYRTERSGRGRNRTAFLNGLTLAVVSKGGDFPRLKWLSVTRAEQFSNNGNGEHWPILLLDETAVSVENANGHPHLELAALNDWAAPDFVASSYFGKKEYYRRVSPSQRQRQKTADYIPIPEKAKIASVLIAPDHQSYVIEGIEIDGKPLRFRVGYQNLSAFLAVLAGDAAGEWGELPPAIKSRIKISNKLKRWVMADLESMSTWAHVKIPTSLKFENGQWVANGYREISWKANQVERFKKAQKSLGRVRKNLHGRLLRGARLAEPIHFFAAPEPPLVDGKITLRDDRTIKFYVDFRDNRHPSEHRVVVSHLDPQDPDGDWEDFETTLVQAWPRQDTSSANYSYTFPSGRVAIREFKIRVDGVWQPGSNIRLGVDFDPKKEIKAAIYHDAVRRRTARKRLIELYRYYPERFDKAFISLLVAEAQNVFAPGVVRQVELVLRRWIRLRLYDSEENLLNLMRAFAVGGAPAMFDAGMLLDFMKQTRHAGKPELWQLEFIRVLFAIASRHQKSVHTDSVLRQKIETLFLNRKLADEIFQMARYLENNEAAREQAGVAFEKIKVHYGLAGARLASTSPVSDYTHRSSELILAAARQIEKPETALLLGFGKGGEYADDALRELAKTFKKIIVVDLNTNFARKRFAGLGLQAEFQTLDLTGLSEGFEQEIDEAVFRADDLEDAFDVVLKMLDKKSHEKPRPADLKASLVVSSLVASQLVMYFDAKANEALKNYYGQEGVDLFAARPERLQAFDRLRDSLQAAHLDNLKEWVEPAGRVYLADTPSGTHWQYYGAEKISQPVHALLMPQFWSKAEELFHPQGQRSSWAYRQLGIVEDYNYTVEATTFSPKQPLARSSAAARLASSAQEIRQGVEAAVKAKDHRRASILINGILQSVERKTERGEIENARQLLEEVDQMPAEALGRIAEKVADVKMQVERKAIATGLYGEFTEENIVNFVVKVRKATDKSKAKLMIGSLQIDYRESSRGELVIEGFPGGEKRLGRDKWKKGAAEDEIEIQLPIADFKMVFQQVLINTKFPDTGVNQPMKPVVLNIAVDAFNPDLPGFKEVVLPMLVRELRWTALQKSGQSAQFLLQGAQPNVDMVYDALRQHSMKFPRETWMQHVYTRRDQLPQRVVKSPEVLLTTPLQQVARSDRHIYHRELKEGDIPNFRALFVIGLAWARVETVKTTDPEFKALCQLIENLTGVKVTSAADLLNPSLSVMKAVPPIATFKLNQAVQAARLAFKMLDASA